MNHNSSRLRWYLIRPFDTGMLGRLAKGMLEAKYEEDSGFGYILGDVRKSFITGRFVQRETVTRLILDPHGSERNFSFENYQSTSFVIRDLAPHLELRNPCRRLSELFTSIGDLLDNSVAITPIEAQCSSWLSVLKKAGCVIHATKVVTENVSLSNTVSVKATFSGSRDVRAEVSKFFDSKKIVPSSVNGIIEYAGESAKFKLSSNGVFHFLSQPSEGLADALRVAAGSLAPEL